MLIHAVKRSREGYCLPLIAYTDDICGALSGAIMVIGLRYGRIQAYDTAAKEKTYAVVVVSFFGNSKHVMAQ